MSSKNSEPEVILIPALRQNFIRDLLLKLINLKEVQENRPSLAAAMVSALQSLSGSQNWAHTVRLSLCQTTKPPVLSISIEAHIPLSFATGERLKERLPPLAEGTTTRGGR